MIDNDKEIVCEDKKKEMDVNDLCSEEGIMRRLRNVE